MKANIVLEENAPGFEPYINKYSNQADVTFITAAKYKESDEPEHYFEGLQMLFKQSSDLGICLYVVSFDNVEHNEIYYYPTDVARGIDV